MRISDWSSDVCSSDLRLAFAGGGRRHRRDEDEAAVGTSGQIREGLRRNLRLGAAEGQKPVRADAETLDDLRDRQELRGTRDLDVAPDVAPDVALGLSGHVVPLLAAVDRKSTRMNSSHE